MKDFMDFKRYAAPEKIAQRVWMSISDRPMSTNPTPEMQKALELSAQAAVEVLGLYHDWLHTR